MDLSQLREPFPSADVEWRIGRAGKNDKGVWAMCLAYITNRAIMERLDDVCGPENWRNEYKDAPAGGVLCGISIRVGDEWVTKWDGADNTEMEAVKGGLSGSMKRAAVQWGIGRYLYHLPEGWATISSQGQHFGRLPQKLGGDSFRWDPPGLPEWALPGGSGKPNGDPARPATDPRGNDGTAARPKQQREDGKVPATPKQTKLVEELAKSSVLTDDERDGIRRRLLNGMSIGQAKEAIDWLTETVKERTKDKVPA